MEKICPETLIRCRPELIKPNLYELGLILSEEGLDVNSAPAAMDRLVGAGVGAVLLSLGKDGAMYADGEVRLRLTHPDTEMVNKVGAGDAMLASFIGMREKGRSVREALAYAGAAGNATASRLEEKLLDEVRKAAVEAEQVVVFAGLPERYESEGFDRDDLKMPEGHIRMIEAAVQGNPDTAVVLICGAPVECPWADEVKAVLYPGLPGQGGAEAVVRLLFGDAVPCGKLAETWPYRYEDCVTSSYYGSRDAEYREGIYVGYRRYDAAGMEVRWPFGHGLSYTSFRYSGLKAEGRKISVTVTNTGDRAGKETVQIYVGPDGDSTL